MTSNTKRTTIPEPVAETVATADDATLREIVDFVQRELADRRRDRLDVEPKPGEELAEVSEERGYTRVVLRQPCAEGCEECPQDRTSTTSGRSTTPTASSRFTGRTSAGSWIRIARSTESRRLRTPPVVETGRISSPRR
jgi:hypothetical protein